MRKFKVRYSVECEATVEADSVEDARREAVGVVGKDWGETLPGSGQVLEVSEVPVPVPSPGIVWERVDVGVLDRFDLPEKVNEMMQTMYAELHQKADSYSMAVACLIDACRRLVPVIRPEHEAALSEIVRAAISKDWETQAWLAERLGDDMPSAGEIERGANERIRQLYASTATLPVLVDPEPYAHVQTMLRELDRLTS